jgi:hypothetical protein
MGLVYSCPVSDVMEGMSGFLYVHDNSSTRRVLQYVTLPSHTFRIRLLCLCIPSRPDAELLHFHPLAPFERLPGILCQQIREHLTHIVA